MKKILFSVFAVMFAQQAFANQTVFSCFMKNGKHLSVTKIGNSFQYNYGKPGKPEMTFTNRIANIEKSCGTAACQMTMVNKGVEYDVYGSYRMEDDGGVIVSKKGKTLAHTKCDARREIYVDGNAFF